jgi:hypothetical protein
MPLWLWLYSQRTMMTGVLWCSLTKRTRLDELLEDTDDALEKGKNYHRNSLFLQLGKVRSVNNSRSGCHGTVSCSCIRRTAD